MFFLFIHLSTDTQIASVSIVNNDEMNTGVQISLNSNDLSSFECIPRNGVAE